MGKPRLSPPLPAQRVGEAGRGAFGRELEDQKLAKQKAHQEQPLPNPPLLRKGGGRSKISLMYLSIRSIRVDLF